MEPTTGQVTNRLDLRPDAFARAWSAFPPDVLADAGRYADRVREALRDPDRATPRLAAAARVWRGHPFSYQDANGEPVPDDHETIAKVLLGLHTAAAVDDADAAQDAGRADVDAIVRELPPEIGVREAARILGVSKDTVGDYIKEGRLPAKNIGREGKKPTYRLRLADVLASRDSFEVARPPSDDRPPEPKRRRVWGVRAVNGTRPDGRKYKHLDTSKGSH